MLSTSFGLVKIVFLLILRIQALTLAITVALRIAKGKVSRRQSSSPLSSLHAPPQPYCALLRSLAFASPLFTSSPLGVALIAGEFPAGTGQDQGSKAYEAQHRPPRPSNKESGAREKR